MTLSHPATLIAVIVVVLATVAIGAYGQRFSRTTSDFLVASQSVPPGWNAAAISGEYLSAASFLGIAGLIVQFGPDALWYPVGFTAGYLALLLFVAAPLRRSGAFTVPDFTQIRWQSTKLRKLSTAAVLVILWFYLVPQLHGAGLILHAILGVPSWVGIVVVGVAVTANVVAGGMRSITIVQAFQYWLKLAALVIPTLVLVAHLGGQTLLPFKTEWAEPGMGLGGPLPLAEVYSLVLATFLGTMGLPHVLVRFYTNVDGPAARRTTVHVLGLLGLFYLFPTILGLLSRSVLGSPGPNGPDLVLLDLPTTAIPGIVGSLLAALIAAGAVAAFLSTSSGLVVAAAGVLSTDLLRGRVRDFRLAAIIAASIPIVLALGTAGLDITRVVGMAFAVAASTFCPLLVLGIWWRGITAIGAAAGVLLGGGLALTAVVLSIFARNSIGELGWLFAQPAVITVPIAFGTMVITSLATKNRVPADVDGILARLHLPGNAEPVPD